MAYPHECSLLQECLKLVDQVLKAVDKSHKVVVLHVEPHCYGPVPASCGAAELAMNYQDRMIEAEVQFFLL